MTDTTTPVNIQLTKPVKGCETTLYSRAVFAFPEVDVKDGFNLYTDCDT